MVNTSRRFKLEYNDAVDGTTVIAETGQDTGALKIDRHYHQRRKRDPDILKVWLEGTNFGDSIPTRKGEFGDAKNNTDEPEILYKQYNPDTDSFDTKGRFFAKNTGTIDEDGRLALKLYSFMRFTERQQVDTPVIDGNNDGGDIEAALNAVLPSGYVADVPAGATVPSVDGYSINARREKGYHELTRDYKFVINFTANLDANNDYKVKFEPEGFGGTVDTLVDNQQAGSYAIQDVDTANDIFTVVGDRTDELVVNQAIEVIKSTGNDDTYTISALNYDSNNNETDITISEDVTDSTADGLIIPGGQAVFKVWEKDKTDAIINKVTVEGTDSNGITITGTATNQTQIDNFGEKFLKVKRGYIESQSDADTIAEKYLVPGLKDNGDDITTVPENGTVKTSVYSDNVLNDSFQVVSSRRNIDDTYTVASQKNFWPEAATVIEFEFEAENLEEAARESENLRDERGRLYPDTSTDVGNQIINSDTESGNSDLNRDQDVTASGSDGPNKETANLRRDPDTSVGQVNTELGYFVGAYNDDITADNGDGWVAADFGVLLDADDYLFNAGFPSIQVTVDRISTGEQNCDVLVRMQNTTTGEYFPDQAGVKIMDSAFMSGATDEQYTISVSQYLHAPFNWNDERFEIQYNIDVNSLVDAQMFYSYHGSNGHVHDDDIEIEREDTGELTPQAVLETDPQANITSQPIFSDNGHVHLFDTTTDAKNINITTEDKTDR